MITAKFTGENQATAFGLWQWDYGRALCIEGLQLPPCVEVQFSQCNTGGDAELVDGTTIDSKTYVPIPQHFLENESVSDYDFYAFVFLYDQNGGHTVKRIRIPVKSKPKPATYVSPDQESAFRAAVKEIDPLCFHTLPSPHLPIWLLFARKNTQPAYLPTRCFCSLFR